ncbi:VWA domain-containing protein [Terriglobus saanensis]|uniref:VWFA-related domain-containing protein n=1 Tax=Terriglobus saanensis (strain ATCC BAA-1853 / DSM 23119 / SP1PR4) TaxID=401053 RepID=E8UYB5_TERSS|nr:VWA domain-containing protein [Terriglobus saanensis]ADV82003.1 VWFA-related domain-containing protein [Terriglobus saanensis SP1PR4]
MKLAAVLLAFPLVLAASAQQADVPVLRVETRLVNVPVNATDAMDVPIPDLKQSDFQILEEGKPQKIAIFERQATTPLSMVMAIDTSESVITQFQTERDAAKRFVKQMLREQDEMDLISFSDTVDEIVPFTNDAGRMNAGIGNLHKGDATSLYDAIYLASQRLTEAKRDATRRKILVIVTDGGNTTKGMRYQQAVEAAERAGAAIYPIIMVPIEADAGRNTGGEHALIQMAQDTGGKYFYVLDKHDLDKAFAHLSDDLRTQYLLGYYAPPRHRDDGFRTINVHLTDAARAATAKLRYKSGYFADGR